VRTSETDVCPDEYETLFTRQWPGTKSGCDCKTIFFSYIPVNHVNQINEKICTKNHKMAGCRNENLIAPHELPDLGDFKICGKRGGDSFLGIQRPLDLNGTCPEGFKTCYSEYFPEKRLCSLEPIMSFPTSSQLLRSSLTNTICPNLHQLRNRKSSSSCKPQHANSLSSDSFSAFYS
jgi:hypothetical protein